MKGKKILAVVGLVLIAGMIFSVESVFAETGKGDLRKCCFYDHSPPFPVEDAKVVLKNAAGDEIDSGYTGSNGCVTFTDVPYGTYYIWVDVGDDGSWETTNEEVMLNQEFKMIMNDDYPYTPPTVLLRTHN